MKKLLKTTGMRNRMLMHFARILAKNPRLKTREVQVYADEDE
jgi:deoxyribodipyrimidine photolyase